MTTFRAAHFICEKWKLEWAMFLYWKVFVSTFLDPNLCYSFEICGSIFQICSCPKADIHLVAVMVSWTYLTLCEARICKINVFSSTSTPHRSCFYAEYDSACHIFRKRSWSGPTLEFAYPYCEIRRVTFKEVDFTNQFTDKTNNIITLWGHLVIIQCDIVRSKSDFGNFWGMNDGFVCNELFVMYWVIFIIFYKGKITIDKIILLQQMKNRLSTKMYYFIIIKTISDEKRICCRMLKLSKNVCASRLIG